MSSVPTVEVFQDNRNMDMSAEIALAGIRFMQHAVGPFEVISTRRRVNFMGDSTVLNLESLKNLMLKADIGIILTEQQIVGAGAESPLGAALCTNIGPQVAAVMKTPGHEATNTFAVAHEMGHMLSIQKGLSGDSHCGLNDCIMYSMATNYTRLNLKAQKGLRLVAEKLGYRAPELLQDVMPQATSFCTDCTTQLKASAVRMMLGQSRQIHQGR